MTQEHVSKLGYTYRIASDKGVKQTPVAVSALNPEQSAEVQRIQLLPKAEQDKAVRELLSKTHNPNARHSIRCIFWL